MADTNATTDIPAGATGTPFLISRVFDAPRELVWQTFTRPEHLQHWWGPKGFKMLSCTVDLRPGGLFHYGMEGPNGMVMWGRWVFQEIVAPSRLSMLIAFSDRDGGVTRHPMAPVWPAEMWGCSILTEENGKTRLSTRTMAFNATDEERRAFEGAFAGMEQGFSGTYDQLDEYLARL